MDVLLTFIAGCMTMGALAWARARYLGFSGQKPEDYSDADSSFDLRQHLNGHMICEGVIFGPTGRVSSRFTADFHITWTGNYGVMTEHFRYSTGETQTREWRLTVLPDGKVRAEADDLVGVGDGVQSGPGVKLEYRIRLPESSGGHVLDAIDWMYLVDNGTIINRSQFRKYGIKVAELVATIRPVSVTGEAKEAA